MKLKSNQNGIAHIGVLIIVLVLIVIGIVGWRVLDSKNKKVKPKTETIKKLDEESDNTKSAQTKETTSTYTNGNKTISVSITHPTDWTVTNKENNDPGNISKIMSVKSPLGFYLHISDPVGFGGSCDLDKDSYTLVKKISTTNNNIFFTEYTTASKGYPDTFMRIEDLSNSKPAHKNLKEGDSNTGVCENVSGYSSVSGVSKDNVFIVINDNADKTRSSNVKYSDLSKDTEFIKMLGTLKVTDL